MDTSRIPVRSAGVLPYTFTAKNELLFLLGREGYVPGWKESDKWGFFCGKIEPQKDACVEHGAARECYEETAGVLFELPELREKLRGGAYRLALDAAFQARRTVCFFVHVRFHDYAAEFRKSKHFVQYCGGKVDCIEKSQIKWFGYEQLRTELFSSGPRPGRIYNHKPHFFRRKFVEMMRYFYEHYGVAHLESRGEPVPKRVYIQFTIADKRAAPSAGAPKHETENVAQTDKKK